MKLAQIDNKTRWTPMVVNKDLTKEKLQYPKFATMQYAIDNWKRNKTKLERFIMTNS
jgi:hypothetical protein